MKKICVGLIFITFAAFSWAADESDVILQAQNDATEDGRNYHAVWWGVGGVAVTVVPFLGVAFFGDAMPVDARRVVALTAPVLGAAGLGLIGYCTGKAEVPDARTSEIRNRYDDSGLVSLYETEYRKTLTSLQRRTRGNAALLGAGVSVGAMAIGFLVVVLTK
jgi:hypothetical protein